MPNLITIYGCESLEMVPKEIKYITTLQTFEIRYMPQDFIRRLQVINGKEGEDFYKVQHVPSISLIDSKSIHLYFFSFFPSTKTNACPIKNLKGN